ncbi:hypothetical protein L7F22_027714 [Adiantum nelumboides]|nr:hypothetical protein [Adiantum nelumboides]
MAQPCSLPSDALFLGLDSSSQSLKATVLDSSFRVLLSSSVHFDSELPHFNTKDGVHRGPEGKVTAPVLMWVEALGLLLDKLKQNNFPFARVKAVSGSGQQHGSVYWRRICSSPGKILKTLDASKDLHLQLEDAFSTLHSPIWMDSSTSKQCRSIEATLGGADVLANITGSRAYERFTGPQIRKLYECERHVYDNTERISLVSSFMASLLFGDYVGIDYSDGAGMNLMDLKQRVWSKAVLDATAPGLQEKLGNLAPSHEVAGKLNAYFVESQPNDKIDDVVAKEENKGGVDNHVPNNDDMADKEELEVVDEEELDIEEDLRSTRVGEKLCLELEIDNDAMQDLIEDASTGTLCMYLSQIKCVLKKV